MNVPEDLHYTSDHEWVKVTGATVRIGITDYAQDALGDVVFIQLPTAGASVSTHDSFSEIESTKSVNDVYAPVAGTVTAINDDLSSSPELLNTDPYGRGWICEIEASEVDLDTLLTPAQYRELIGA
jgi:glycine cleavage system H protein